MRSNLWNQLVSLYLNTTVPFPGLKLVTLAQWALESGWGESALAEDHLNFAGLKFRERMQGFAEPVDYAAHDGEDTYCAFDDMASFIGGYWHFVSSGPYHGWEAFGEDPLGYIQHLKSNGYAGDPNYVAKVVAIHDTLAEELGIVAELDRPSKAVLGEKPFDVTYEKVSGAKHKQRGNYDNGVEGIIVHYDAGRIRPRYSEQEDSDWGSRKTIEWGSDRYAYMCISRTGKVFLPENWDMAKWGSHAGKSKCPVTGRDWVSQFYFGIEMNNPGYLYEAQEDGVFCPWFNSKRYPSGHVREGQVILDSRKRCYRVNSNDEWFTRDQVRHASGENIAAGYYLPYTHAQFHALVGVILDQMEQHPTIRKDLIFGHDEISPGRKQDPGGALGTPGELVYMSKLRQMVSDLL